MELAAPRSRRVEEMSAGESPPSLEACILIYMLAEQGAELLEAERRSA
jgi:hypothetical protein